jgi:transcriptional regulator with XRE-family HTH domain
MPSNPRRARSSDHVALGRALRQVRERRGLTQELVAFDAGVSDEYLGCVERGTLNPSFSMLLGIARTLGLTASELIEVYERFLREIDPQAGQDVPLCPTPEALAYRERSNAKQRERMYAAIARRRGRIKPWT